MSGFQAAAVSGSVMILVIALLRLTAGKRLPRALFPALWCAAAFRLLLPVRLPSALRVWHLPAGAACQAFLCGPPKMLEAARKTLLAKGLDNHDIFADEF